MHPEIINLEIINLEIINLEIINLEITNLEITNPEITNPEITSLSLASLPSTLEQAIGEVAEEAQSLGMDASTLLALMMLPLTSEHFADAERALDQRLDSLRVALRQNSVGLMRLLSRVSFAWFVECATRFRQAETSYQRTWWRVVLCGDDSLLVHSEESGQRGVANLFSTLYKRCRKAHDLVFLGVTVGAQEGGFFFPLWVEL